jgi:hypothetical protein
VRFHADKNVSLISRAPNLFDRGPFSRLFEGEAGTRLSAPARARHAALLALLAWLPLVLLSVTATDAPIRAWFTSLRLDVDTARYLVAIPLLVMGQRVLTRQLNSIVQVFVRGGYVGGAETDRLDRLLESTRRLLVHPVAAAGIVLVAFVLSLLTTRMRDTIPLTPAAGLWRLLVSQPLFLACAGEWLWRVAVWARLVWRISTFHLRLSPAHPDLSAGLLFVSRAVPAFMPLAAALGSVAAAALGHMMLVEHRSASEYLGVLLGVLVALLAIAAGPLLPLALPIRRAKLRGIVEYGVLANQLGRRFEERWLRRDVLPADALASPDFSATTDLYSIASNVTRVRLIPVSIRAVVVLLLAALVPFVPVVALTVPVTRVLQVASTLLF